MVHFERLCGIVSHLVLFVDFLKLSDVKQFVLPRRRWVRALLGYHIERYTYKIYDKDHCEVSKWLAPFHRRQPTP